TLFDMPCDLSMGVEAVAAKSVPSLQLQPNPASSTVRLHGAPAGSLCTLADATGRVLWTKRPALEELDVSDLAHGVYVFTLHDVEGRTLGSVRMIKQ
ncbi:MAG TPA: T9SS type A sorting domain-containing protein, partial [Flavobacteriales bacterium]|nr:T9SS type A sorting domain-containing protein [Flavobacteriales bacterium]